MLKLIKVLLLSCLLLTNQASYSNENASTANQPQKTFYSNWPQWLPTLSTLTACVAGAFYGARNCDDLANRFNLPTSATTEDITTTLTLGLTPYWEAEVLKSCYYKPYAKAFGLIILNLLSIDLCRKIATLPLESLNNSAANDQKLNNKAKPFNIGLAASTLSIAAVSAFLTTALVVAAKKAHNSLEESIAEAINAAHCSQ